MGRFFPYLGGKTALVPRLLKLIPPHRVYVEVFGGSAKLRAATRAKGSRRSPSFFTQVPGRLPMISFFFVESAIAYNTLRKEVYHWMENYLGWRGRLLVVKTFFS